MATQTKTKTQASNGKSTTPPPKLPEGGWNDLAGGERTEGEWVDWKVGTVVAGVLTDAFSFKGKFGRANSYVVAGKDGNFIFSEKAGHRALRGVRLGTEVRVEYTGDIETKGGTMKNFRISTRKEGTGLRAERKFTQAPVDAPTDTGDTEDAPF